MAKIKRTAAQVLRYTMQENSQRTVRRFYAEWRLTQGLPSRCDNPECTYFTAPLQWNGQPLSLILDHINGNHKDNGTENLRLLCPNCDSQLPTRGGRNKGRIQNASEGGYEVAHRSGSRDAKVFPRGVSLTASVGQVSVQAGARKTEN
jgi:5-methylcytosine-specific restriction endonuclease McrA